MNSKQLREFELLNTTTESIYELNGLRVLIILYAGSNLTSWREVRDREEIIYISEDLFGEHDLAGRYKGFTNLRAVVASGFGDVHDLSNLFAGCESLVDISSLKSWDVSNVANMSGMFDGCTSLKDISALSNWKTSKVQNISGMFFNCYSLEDISPLADWTFPASEICITYSPTAVPSRMFPH